MQGQPPGGQWAGQWGAAPYPVDPRPQDDEHLRVLVICHYVMAAILALLSLIPLIYVAVGAMFITNMGGMATPSTPSAPPPPAFVGWFFIAFGAIITFFGEVLALCTFFVGRSLAARKNWLFCVIIAAFNCLHMPLGTALGVFTLIVLLRQSVKATFQGAVV